MLLDCNSLLRFIRTFLTLCDWDKEVVSWLSGCHQPGGCLLFTCLLWLLLTYGQPQCHLPAFHCHCRFAQTFHLYCWLQKLSWKLLNANLQLSIKWKSARRWGKHLRNPRLNLGWVFIIFSVVNPPARPGQCHSMYVPAIPALPNQHYVSTT